MRATGRPHMTLEDIRTVCMSTREASHPGADLSFNATIADKNVVGVIGG